MQHLNTQYKFREWYIPSRMMSGIRKYIEHGIIPGDFLQAVISNDLPGACGHADQENLANLPAYVAYFYNEASSDCWGTRNAMLAWAKMKQGERFNVLP